MSDRDVLNFFYNPPHDSQDNKLNIDGTSIISSEVFSANDFRNGLKTSISLYDDVESTYIPIKNESGGYNNSPFRYDEENNRIISTAEILVPPATVFVGEDVALRNHGGFLSSTNLQNLENTGTKILVGRTYGQLYNSTLNGSQTPITVANFGEEQFDFNAQGLDDEFLTISGTDRISVVFTEVLPAMITAHNLRGVFGKCYWDLQTAKNPADNNLSDEDFLLLPDDELINIVNGAIGLQTYFDFDNPKDRNGVDDGNGTSFVRYKSPVDFDQGRKIKITWYSADGNSVRFKGSTINGRFFPFTQTDFHLRETEVITTLNENGMSSNYHWSSLKVDNMKGWADYNHSGAGSPQPLTIGIFNTLINDGIGGNTRTDQLPSDITTLYDAGANSLDLSELKVGDMVKLRVDYLINVDANNRRLDNRLFVQAKDAGGNPTFSFALPETTRSLGLGGGTQYQQICNYDFYIGHEDVLRGDLFVQARCSGNAAVTMNGYYVRVSRKDNANADL